MSTVWVTQLILPARPAVHCPDNPTVLSGQAV
jgi:hypothetical protein